MWNNASKRFWEIFGRRTVIFVVTFMLGRVHSMGRARYVHSQFRTHFIILFLCLIYVHTKDYNYFENTVKLQFKDASRSIARTIQNNLMDNSKQESFDLFLTGAWYDSRIFDRAANILPPPILQGKRLSHRFVLFVLIALCFRWFLLLRYVLCQVAPILLN